MFSGNVYFKEINSHCCHELFIRQNKPLIIKMTSLLKFSEKEDANNFDP